MAEVSSAISRRVWAGGLTPEVARGTPLSMPGLRVASRVELVAADIAAATAFLRRLDLTLRTPGALHIAAA